ncbi:DUF4278 domain-containing protein [Halomicronema sp. CCY15110]|uniref:DUF4278 domain-containing protein n=1 Tax=Halomicronema sp. CCY15110 TaxID=2767773 RepID=UPI00194FA116|nr:DUF4278 domain-containing protein [Halomicronema sp. CCY15110]
MKLIYRGIPYETSASVETARPHPFRQTNKSADSPVNLRHPGPELTYRGVRYTP